MIPKIVFTYWEGDQLSILHYFTIYSLHKYNPDLDIIIYTDKNPKNILREWDTHEHSINIEKKMPLSKLIEINPEKILLKPINFQEEYNFDNNISIIFKADFTRISKLYEHGGIWFDMDILFIKPIPDFFFNEDVDSHIFIYSGVIATGLLTASPKCSFLEKLFNGSLEIINKKELNNYQKIGPIIWIQEYNKLNEEEKREIKILDNSLVYPYIWNELEMLFKNKNTTVPENTFGIHWYNGALMTKEFINNFDIKNINPNNSLFEKLVYELDNLEDFDIFNEEDLDNLIIEAENEENLDNLIIEAENEENLDNVIIEAENNSILNEDKENENSDILLQKLFDQLFNDSIIKNFDNFDKFDNKNKNENNLEEINIELKNSNNLEIIQTEYYNKILNSNKNFVIRFIIPKKLIKTRALRFFKCWRNGYCLNDSSTKIPKNIKKVFLKKI
jgi:hypothetical protein